MPVCAVAGGQPRAFPRSVGVPADHRRWALRLSLLRFPRGLWSLPPAVSVPGAPTVAVLLFCPVPPVALRPRFCGARVPAVLPARLGVGALSVVARAGPRLPPPVSSAACSHAQRWCCMCALLWWGMTSRACCVARSSMGMNCHGFVVVGPGPSGLACARLAAISSLLLGRQACHGAACLIEVTEQVGAHGRRCWSSPRC